MRFNYIFIYFSFLSLFFLFFFIAFSLACIFWKSNIALGPLEILLNKVDDVRSDVNKSEFEVLKRNIELMIFNGAAARFIVIPNRILVFGEWVCRLW